MFKSSVFCVFFYLGDASQVPSSAFSRPICGIIGIIRLLAGKTISLRGVGGRRVGGWCGGWVLNMQEMVTRPPPLLSAILYMASLGSYVFLKGTWSLSGGRDRRGGGCWSRRWQSGLLQCIQSSYLWHSLVRIIYLSGVESMSLGWGVIRGMGGRGCNRFIRNLPAKSPRAPVRPTFLYDVASFESFQSSSWRWVYVQGVRCGWYGRRGFNMLAKMPVRFWPKTFIFKKHPIVQNLGAFSTIFFKKHPIWTKLDAFLIMSFFNLDFWLGLVIAGSTIVFLGLTMIHYSACVTYIYCDLSMIFKRFETLQLAHRYECSLVHLFWHIIDLITSEVIVFM